MTQTRVQEQMAAMVRAYPGLAGKSEEEMNCALNECAYEIRKRGFMSVIYASMLIAFGVAFVSFGMYSKYGNPISLVAGFGSYVLLALWLRSAWRKELRTELGRRFGKTQVQQASSDA